MFEIYKHKGDSSLCDNSKGILLADHASKGFVSRINNSIDPKYSAHMPNDQYGAVAGKGTYFASHLIRSMMDIAEMQNYCTFVLFVDLVKAFDKAVRELVFGWPTSMSSPPEEYLISLGVDAEAAAWITDYLQHKWQ